MALNFLLLTLPEIGYSAQTDLKLYGICGTEMHLPLWVIDWDTVFRLGHSPIQAVHSEDRGIQRNFFFSIEIEIDIEEFLFQY